MIVENKSMSFREHAEKTGRWWVLIGHDPYLAPIFRDNAPGDPLPEDGVAWGLPAKGIGWSEARMAGPPREIQALRLIAQRAQVAGPEDAEEALTWIYRMASSTAEAFGQERAAHIDGLVVKMLYELHRHVPETDRPVSMSDLSDEQADRARDAVRAILALT